MKKFRKIGIMLLSIFTFVFMAHCIEVSAGDADVRRVLELEKPSGRNYVIRWNDEYTKVETVMKYIVDNNLDPGYNLQYTTDKHFQIKLIANVDITQGADLKLYEYILAAVPDNVDVEYSENGLKNLQDFDSYSNMIKNIIEEKNSKRSNVKIIYLDGSPSDYCSTTSVFSNPSKEWKKIIDDAYNAGILIVAPAGTGIWPIQNLDNNCLLKHEKVVVVGSTAAGLEEYDNESNYGSSVDFIAPYYTGFKNGDKDSSAAQVVIDMALLYTICPSCTAQEIESVLVRSSSGFNSIQVANEGRVKDPAGKKGYGYIDMSKALYEIFQKQVTLEVCGAGLTTFGELIRKDLVEIKMSQVSKALRCKETTVTIDTRPQNGQKKLFDLTMRPGTAFLFFKTHVAQIRINDRVVASYDRKGNKGKAQRMEFNIEANTHIMVSFTVL